MKCEHGVYIPQGETVSIYCSLCNPNGVPDGPVPVLPRSSGDPLSGDKTGKLETCSQCGNVRTFISNTCLVCGTPFPITEERGRQQGTANIHQPGVCPDCGSTVHYQAKKKNQWICADCDKVYAAPKRRTDE